MQTRKINTNLVKRLEAFRILALGEALNTPVLLIGVPGTGKTQTVMDYAKATAVKNVQDSINQRRNNGEVIDAIEETNLIENASSEVFMLETDEGTRSTAVKGNIDLKKLTTENVYNIDSPITRAEVVVINEIDKASPSLRNSFLSIMNERVLFNGTEKIECQWRNFIATCNEIPDDEKDSPFWDRFLVTFKVNRMSPADMLKYYKNGGKTFRQNHNIMIPEQADIDAISITPAKFKKIMDVVYKKLSDRSLSYLPTIIKNVMGIWKMGEDKAIIKTVELLVDKHTAKELAKTLVHPLVAAINDAIDAIGQCTTNSDYNNRYDEVEAKCKAAKKAGAITDADFKDITLRIEEEESKLDFLDHAEEVN